MIANVYSQQFESLWAILKQSRPIAFSSHLAQITGHPRSTILLSQLIYWTRHGRNVVQNNGWIFKTREAWQRETGLSRKELETARAHLRQLGFVEEARSGQPARLWYRLRYRALALALNSYHNVPPVEPLSLESIRDEKKVLRDILGPAVAYHRVLTEVTGSVHAGLLLSRLLHYQRRTIAKGSQWFAMTQRDWKAELGLNRRQLEKAKQKLYQLCLIEEKLTRNMCLCLFTQVNPGRLLELLQPAVDRLGPKHFGSVDKTIRAMDCLGAKQSNYALPSANARMVGSADKARKRVLCWPTSIACLGPKHSRSVGKANHAIDCLGPQHLNYVMSSPTSTKPAGLKAPLTDDPICLAEGTQCTLESVRNVLSSRPKMDFAMTRARKTTKKTTTTTTTLPANARVVVGANKTRKLAMCWPTSIACLELKHAHSVDKANHAIDCLGPKRFSSARPFANAHTVGSADKARKLILCWPTSIACLGPKRSSTTPPLANARMVEQGNKEIALYWPAFLRSTERSYLQREYATVPQRIMQEFLDEMTWNQRKRPVHNPLGYIRRCYALWRAQDWRPEVAHLEAERRIKAAAIAKAIAAGENSPAIPPNLLCIDKAAYLIKMRELVKSFKQGSKQGDLQRRRAVVCS